MGIAFRPIDLGHDEDVRAIVAWTNDRAIRHLHVWCPDEAEYERVDTPASARARLERALARGKRIDMIVADGAVVGDVSFDTDPKPFYRKSPGSAWLGLVIGDATARGRGIGKVAMHHIESAARDAGCSRAEIGVFEFNKIARRLYTGLGYVEIARIPEFTWWNGKMWPDIRLEKRL